MLIMIEKTILARLKRVWQGQEKDRIIWNEGILPNFISPNGEYNPSSFTCYELYKILQESFSYQNLYKHLRKYEMEEFLTSKLVINKNNRKERIYSFSKKRLLNKDIHRIDHIRNRYGKVEARKLFELIQEYNQPKKIYDNYIKKKISKNTAINILQYIINEGCDMFEKHQLESSFLFNSLTYIIKISKKDKLLFSYLEEIIVSHEDDGLRETAVGYVKKYFPKLFETNLSRYLEGKYFFASYSSKSLDDYILTNDANFRYRRFERKLKDLKDGKLLDLHLLAKEKLKKFRTYTHILRSGDYDPLINRLIYNWNISVVYNEIKNFEQEIYENIISVNLRNEIYELWRLKYKGFYFGLKIFNTVLDIKEKDIFVAIPPLHQIKDKGSKWVYHSYKSPIKMFSDKTDFIIYLF